MILYHASPVVLQSGTALRRRSETGHFAEQLRHPRAAAGSIPQVVYLTWSPGDARGWCHAMGSRGKGWHIYAVYVPDQTLVQVHLDDAWSCDGPGLEKNNSWRWVPATEVFIPGTLLRRSGSAGEILVHSRVRVLREVARFRYDGPGASGQWENR